MQAVFYRDKLPRESFQGKVSKGKRCPCSRLRGIRLGGILQMADVWGMIS